jgi:methionyl-tRNA formyltransferase
LAPDLIVVVSYGQIIPKAILDTPVYGCINIHASLLPVYRGAAPIQRAIMAGEEITGVTAMLMDEGLDTGDIIGQMTVKIGPAMNHGELEQRLALVGADLLAETLLLMESGTLPRKKQDEARSTYADMIKPKDEIIDWNKEVAAINNQIRALSPSPGAYTTYAGIRFKIFGGRIVDKKAPGCLAR